VGIAAALTKDYDRDNLPKRSAEPIGAPSSGREDILVLSISGKNNRACPKRRSHPALIR